MIGLPHGDQPHAVRTRDPDGQIATARGDHLPDPVLPIVDSARAGLGHDGSERLDIDVPHSKALYVEPEELDAVRVNAPKVSGNQ